MEMRDFIREFKKGWALIIGVIVINFVAGLFKLTTLSGLVTTIMTNPAGAIATLMATAFLSILFMLVVYPLLIGWLMEEIEKRIRK